MALDTQNTRSRRAVLVGTLGAATALAVQALARPLATRAQGEPMTVGDSFTDAYYLTDLENSDNNSDVFKASSYGSGTGVIGQSKSYQGVYGISNSGRGVSGSSTSGVGVSGWTYGSANGVEGQSVTGAGVYGSATSTSGTTYGVSGLSSSGGGIGVYGLADATGGGNVGVSGESSSHQGTGVSGVATAATGSTTGVYGAVGSNAGSAIYGFAGSPTGTTYAVVGKNESSAGIGAVGWSDANATGVLGFSGNTPIGPQTAAEGIETLPATAAKTGVLGVANQDSDAVGVKGSSTKGRGGVFKGKVAQVRLSPSTASTHPASGSSGDLFVDASGRLWFCKGTTTWKQIA